MDYDVGVLGLANPPASAVVTSYRPAVQVRNNGIHNAQASGYLRIYAAGLLIFETEVYSGTLAPGTTGTADAVDYWTPPAEGTYVINGYVTTPLDQYEPNNNLGPVTIVVKGGPVPPPPTVPLHASQHEEGGTDPVNVDGLPGVLADRQPAQPHAAQHQAGGDDAVNVGGLAGVLGDPQTPIAHGNAHHNPDMATSDELVSHAGSSSAHTDATNLANRDTTGHDVGLVPLAQLQHGIISPVSDYYAFRFDRFFGPAKHASIGVNLLAPITITPNSGTTKLIELQVPVAWLSDDMQFILECGGRVDFITASLAELDVSSSLGNLSPCFLRHTLTIINPFHFILRALIIGQPTNLVTGNLEYITHDADDNTTHLIHGGGYAPEYDPLVSSSTYLSADFKSSNPASRLIIENGYIRAQHPIP